MTKELTNLERYYKVFRNSVLESNGLHKAKLQMRHTRAFQEVSSHFENLEYRWGGFDVTWQPVGRDLIVHP